VQAVPAELRVEARINPRSTPEPMTRRLHGHRFGA